MIAAPQTQSTNNDLGLNILKYWQLILALAGLVYSWAHFQGEVANLNEQVSGYKIQASAIQANQAETSGDIKEINAKLDFLIKKVQL